MKFCSQELQFFPDTVAPKFSLNTWLSFSAFHFYVTYINLTVNVSAMQQVSNALLTHVECPQ